MCSRNEKKEIFENSQFQIEKKKNEKNVIIDLDFIFIKIGSG